VTYFSAIYRAGQGRVYGSDIRARSYDHACVLALKRGLDERVLGLSLFKNRGISDTCSQVLRSRQSTALERLHALAFLGLLGTSSGAVTAREFFDDDVGVLHQWIHLELEKEDPSFPLELPRGLRADLLAAVDEIERAIPGYPVRRRG
jgi:hypothetical protein